MIKTGEEQKQKLKMYVIIYIILVFDQKYIAVITEFV